MLLDFEKPKKITNDYSFEDGPPGGYMPQMSDADAVKWKAKHFNKGKPGERIEIRKSFNGVQVFIIVAKDGWDLAAKNEHMVANDPDRYWGKITKGLNFRMSMNGALMMDFAMFDEFTTAIAEAKGMLTE